MCICHPAGDAKEIAEIDAQSDAQALRSCVAKGPAFVSFNHPNTPRQIRKQRSNKAAVCHCEERVS